MNRRNTPAYRRGKRKKEIVIRSLMLLKRYRDGHDLAPLERATAKLMMLLLTETELEYLGCYYENGLTHRQIARHLHRCPSTVSKGIVRAEGKFWAFADIMEESGLTM